MGSKAGQADLASHIPHTMPGTWWALQEAFVALNLYIPGNVSHNPDPLLLRTNDGRLWANRKRDLEV